MRAMVGSVLSKGGGVVFLVFGLPVFYFQGVSELQEAFGNGDYDVGKG